MSYFGIYVVEIMTLNNNNFSFLHQNVLLNLKDGTIYECEEMRQLNSAGDKTSFLVCLKQIIAKHWSYPIFRFKDSRSLNTLTGDRGFLS